MAKHKLRLDVEISYGSVGHDRKYPYVKAASWVKSLEKHGKLSKLLGFEHLGPEYNRLAACGDLLEDFWRKYRPLHDTHEVFARADAGAIQLRNCVPVYLHGDEGTTYKKDGCLVLSIHTPLGAGTLSQKMGPVVADERDAARTNFAGHALETRFMLAALLKDSCKEKKGKQFVFVHCFPGCSHGCCCRLIPICSVELHPSKEDYREDYTAYYQILELVVRSLDDAGRQGVELSTGDRLHLIPLGNKGDWPYLVTLFFLQQHCL
eukprot:s523_g9.t1